MSGRLWMTYCGHIFGCFFYYFSGADWRTVEEADLVREGMLEPWLKTYFQDTHPSSTDVWDRYIASMYWAFTTMTTVRPATEIAQNVPGTHLFANPRFLKNATL